MAREGSFLTRSTKAGRGEEQEKPLFYGLGIGGKAASRKNGHLAEGLGELHDVECLFLPFRGELVHLDPAPHDDIKTVRFFAVRKNELAPLYAPECRDPRKLIELFGRKTLEKGDIVQEGENVCLPHGTYITQSAPNGILPPDAHHALLCPMFAIEEALCDTNGVWVLSRQCSAVRYRSSSRIPRRLSFSPFPCSIRSSSTKWPTDGSPTKWAIPRHDGLAGSPSIHGGISTRWAPSCSFLSASAGQNPFLSTSTT